VLALKISQIAGIFSFTTIYNPVDRNAFDLGIETGLLPKRFIKLFIAGTNFCYFSIF
jgi:hypothetical protein